MNARHYPGFPPPPERGQRRLDWSFVITGYARTVADRYAPGEYLRRIPANDRDGYRW